MSQTPPGQTTPVPPNALDAFRLDGKVAVITGAASGIGAATAELFSLAGARIVGGDINAEAGQATIARIAEHGGEAVFAATNVTKREEVEGLVDRAIGEFGRVDIVANIAGAMFPGLLEDVKDDQIDAGFREAFRASAPQPLGRSANDSPFARDS